MIPMCWKCADGVLGPPQGKLGGRELIGCKKLSQEQWQEGWRPEVGGSVLQHNCPISLILRPKDEKSA